MSGRVAPSPCVAPTSRGRACPDTPVADAPFPLCVHHLAIAWRFAQDRIAAARTGRHGTDQRRLPPPDELIALAAAAPVRDGVVYYLRVGALIKIGVTGDLDQRLRSYPPDVQVLATEPGDSRLEARRLDQFSAHVAHAGRREWFHPSTELDEHIASLT